MLLILVKVYELRLSRAERKYDVQGDRSTQVPFVLLPVSVEDCFSEDEDQTLLEINRQKLRILGVFYSEALCSQGKKYNMSKYEIFHEIPRNKRRLAKHFKL